MVDSFTEDSPMKTIRIWFDELDGCFDIHSNFISSILKEKYHIVLDNRNPEYLFFTYQSKNYLKYNCVRIFYTAENIIPDFNLCDYAIGFSRMEFGDRYIRYPLYLVDGFIAYSGDDYARDLLRAQHKHENLQEIWKEKTAFCSFVYSNGNAAKCREKIFRALSAYKQVDSGGRYMNNIGGPVEDKLAFQKKHKFVIAFENTSSPGYTTEKIVHAFSAGAIPIYWGDPEVSKDFNPASFIDCNAMGLREEGDDYIIERIVERVKELDHNDDLYKAMLSAPAFYGEDDVETQNRKLKEFLFHIFDQENAFRRNRIYIGERYERKQRIGNAFYWQCRKAIPLRDAMIKIIRAK